MAGRKRDERREQTERELLAALAGPRWSDVTLKPGALELLMLALRRVGASAIDGKLCFPSDGDAQEVTDRGLKMVDGYAEVENLFAAATAARARAESLGTKPAQKEAARALRKADDSLLDVALVAWVEEWERTASPHDKEQADRLLLQVRARKSQRFLAAAHGHKGVRRRVANADNRAREVQSAVAELESKGMRRADAIKKIRKEVLYKSASQTRRLLKRPLGDAH